MATSDLLHSVSKNPLTILHGTLRVGPTRVTLDTVVGAFKEGSTAEEIVVRYPSLKLADVYAAIALYLQYRDDVDGYIALREAEADEMQDQNTKLYELRGLRERLLSRALEKP